MTNDSDKEMEEFLRTVFVKDTYLKIGRSVWPLVAARLASGQRPPKAFHEWAVAAALSLLLFVSGTTGIAWMASEVKPPVRVSMGWDFAETQAAVLSGYIQGGGIQ